MKIKSRHKLIPAIAMVLVSAVVLSSASYAWFTMSRTVTATGISLTAVAPTNLLINNKDEEATYAETITVGETYSGKLIPASSTNGTAFFAPTEIKNVAGGAPTVASIFKDVSLKPLAADVENAQDNDKKEGYYADFSLWLKTTGDKDVKVTLSDLLTKIASSTEGTVTGGTAINDAVRFAILDASGAEIADDKKEATNNTYALMNNKIANYTDNVQGLFTGLEGPIVGTTDGTGEGWKGQEITDGNDVTKAQFTVIAGTPMNITVRVWIEGQAKACVGTAAHANFNLTLGFKDVDFVETTP